MGVYSEMDMELREETHTPVINRSLTEEENPFAELDTPTTPPDTQNCSLKETDEESPFDTAEEAEEQPHTAQPPVQEKTQSVEKDASTDQQAAADEDAQRKAHEESEAKRKAEWEAQRQAKINAELEKIAQLNAMSDDKLMDAAIQRIGTDTERLTHRNMKVCVSEHIQAKCLDEPDFARLTLHPRKSMTHCFWYIYRKAREYAEQEMKDNQEKPQDGVYGTDVPDGLCYQWAEEYFRDLDAKEDQEKEEKFVPKPYVSKSKTTSKTTTKGKAKKETVKPAPKEPVTEKKPTPPKTADIGQMTLGDFATMEASA